MLRRIFALLLLACLLSAQEYRSTISGRITDPSGSAVPNVQVSAVKLDTNSRFSTVAGPEGVYVLPQLPPGTYEIVAETSGFKKYVQSGIEVASNVRLAVDITLVLGSTTDSVTITADAPPLTTETASTGQAITTREVENLPINGRSPMNLAVMAFGVVNTGTRDQNRPYENSGFSNFSMGGAPGGGNEVLLDGVPNIGTLGLADRRAAFSPSVDAVAEVKVEVFNVDASYGGTGGGTVEIITKGGGNQIHGALSEFNQVSNLAATPFFTNAAGNKKTVSRQNQWGVMASGPVFLPKIWDGRNKLFWLFTYEGHKNSEPAPTYTTVPTALQRQGNFSELLALGNNYALYDPATAKLSGSTVTRTAFPGNIIPTNRLNQVAQNYLKYIPAPNFAGKADGTNNYFAGLTTNNAYTGYMGRLDVNVSDRNKLSGSIKQSLWEQKSGNLFDNLALGESGLRDIWGGSVDDVHTFGPSLIANLRVGFTRYRAYYNQNSFGYDPTQLGFPSYIAANATRLIMPAFTFNDGYLVASPTTNLHYVDQPFNTYQAFGSVTKIIGTHTLKFGGEHRIYDFSNFGWSGSTGAYTFDATWVKSTSSAAGAPVGSGLAAFLLGLPTSGSYTVNAASKNDANYDVLFFQHDWRVNSALTINTGLRWEHNGGSTERWNRQVVGFDAAAVNAVTAAAKAKYATLTNPPMPASQFNPSGGLLFADDHHRASADTPWTNFSPRLGISWAPEKFRGRTVFRSGVGMFDYLYGVILGQQPGFSITNQYVATSDSYVTPAATLSDPFPVSNPIRQPVGAGNGINTNLGQSITFLNPHLQRQYSLRWTFDIQHQLTHSMTLQVGYVGNHSVHLPTNYNFGNMPASYLSKSLTRDNATISALAAVVSNPFAGLLAGSSINGSTISVANLLRTYPQFNGGVTENNMNNGSSYFHEVAVRLAQRLSHGLLFSANFSHSRLMEYASYLNNGDLNLEKRVSQYDRPNNFSLAGLYELPFGRGRQFGNSVNRPTDLLIGKWNVSAMYTYHTGAPLAWGNVLYLGGDLAYNGHNVDNAFDRTRFDTNSNNQLSQNFRYFPSQFNNIRVDGTSNLNFTVTKDFQFLERLRMQFRGESFNAMNHPLFGGANVTPTNKAFGAITSQTNTPRLIQFALRMTF